MLKTRMLVPLLLLVASVAAPAAALAEPQIVLAIEVAKEQRQQQDGRELVLLVPAEQSGSGDVLVYTLNYVNRGDAPAQGVALVDPIPEGTVYLPDSAAGADSEALFSIDGGRLFQAPPVTYMVTKPDGSQEKRLATPEMYSHIKWRIQRELPPGAAGAVSFKVKVK